jgi:glyoxylase-like metal-dependent hydrolase (beta-lactamase superfamily II)
VGVHRIVTGKWKENCYLAWSKEGDAVVIDPGGELEQIRDHVARESLRVRAVINTHAHYDHLGAVVDVVETYEVPFHLHPEDEDLLVRANFYRTLFLGEEPIRIPTVDVQLSEGTMQFGTLAVDVVHTPGHTLGSVCFEVGRVLFTGDTVMANHLGRTDLPGGDRDVLLSSVDRIAARFPADTRLCPGHGDAAVLGDVISRLPALPELR